MPPLKGSRLCFAHSEDSKMKQKARQARTNGGKKSTRRRELSEEEIPAKIRSIGDCLKLLEITARALAVGRLEPRRGNAIVIAVGTIAKLVADHELEARIKRLEEENSD